MTNKEPTPATKQRPLSVSLIITTYNWPEALELCLRSVLAQTHLPDEIIIADDGSTSETAERIATVAQTTCLPLVHSWQEDQGFRVAMSRNRAIAHSAGEYLILIDGDVMLDSRFVQDHIDAAQQGYFVQGGRVLIDPARTARMLRDKSIALFWGSRGIRNRKNALHSPWLSRLFSTVSTELKGIKTCNFGLYRKDAVQVNGFDNAFVGWGREDNEFANRLFCSGLRRKNLKFSAIAYHIYHRDSSRDALPENELRLARSIRECRVRCENGLDAFLKETPPIPPHIASD